MGSDMNSVIKPKFEQFWLFYMREFCNCGFALVFLAGLKRVGRGDVTYFRAPIRV